jgi:hypothetical protein
LAFVVRPRIVQLGPRQYLVTVYSLETGAGPAPVENHFVARVERTPARARKAMQDLVDIVMGELRNDAGTEIQCEGCPRDVRY